MKGINSAVRAETAPSKTKSKAVTSVKEKPMKATKASKKGEKDPNEPKKPQTAFFLFMTSFRPTCDLKGAAAAKAGGEKWKSMSDEEKKPFVDDAACKKAEYSKVLAAYKGSKQPTTTSESSAESKASDITEGDDMDS